MIKLGGADINKLYLGAAEINKAYLGSQQVWNYINTPLRAIAQNNTFHRGKDAVAGTNRYFFRVPIFVATDSRTIVISHSAWHLGGTAEQNLGNNYTIESAALENPSETINVPVLYSGGRSKTVLNGDSDIKSDPVYASSFSVSKFSRFEIWWLRGILSVPVAGNSIPNGTLGVGAQAGTQGAWYNSANTTPSAVDANGIFTTTGTAPSARTTPYAPVFLGNPVIDGPSWVGIGDSITDGVADTTGGSFDKYGNGGFMRATRDLSDSDWIPNIRFSLSGMAMLAVSGGSNGKHRVYTQYGKGVYFNLGTNDFGLSPGNSLSVVQGRANGFMDPILSLFPSTKFYAAKLGPRASASSDNYATEAGQTIPSHWANGERVDQYNSWLDSLIGTKITQTINYTANRGVAKDHWAQDISGTIQFYVTADGTHDSPRGYENHAAVLRPILRSI